MALKLFQAIGIRPSIKMEIHRVVQFNVAVRSTVILTKSMEVKKLPGMVEQVQVLT